MPNSVTYLDRTPMFEWYVVRCDLPNKDTKITYKRSIHIGLHVLNMINILNSVVHIIIYFFICGVI